MDPRPEPGWRFLPHLIIFCSSACVMVVELVAGRLTGRHMGTSLYTWTSIIGVVLAGMSIGNWAGGRMADRWRPGALLGWLFLIASAACLASLFLNKVVADSPTFIDATANMRYPTRVFLSMVLIFLLPALALGTISPVTAKMALLRGKGVGSTIGSVYAWGAVGSILGTFLTGFWLIATLGSVGVVIAVSGALALMALLLGPWRLLHALWLGAIIFLFWLTQTQRTGWFQKACALGLQEGEKVTKPTVAAPGPYKKLLFARDGEYQFIRVFDRGWGHEMALDAGWHSFVDPSDPSYLCYPYAQIYAGLTERFLGDREKIDAFFIGGGGFAYPRWVLSRWPAASCEVAEIDPLVLEACHQAMGLSRQTPIKTYLNDARMVVRQLPADRKYDLLIGDAFNNELAIPWHLTTLEFHQQLKSHLAPNGILLTNLIDDYKNGGRLLGAYINTVRKVFPHVYIFCTDRKAMEKGGHDNFIIACTERDDPGLDANYPTGGNYFGYYYLGEGEIAPLIAKCGNRILTDDNAPVENLMAPLPRQRLE